MSNSKRVFKALIALMVLSVSVLGVSSPASAAPGLASNISIEFSGTAPFADYGVGGTLEPGDDLSGGQENGFDGIRHYVRTGDRSSVKLEYSVNGEDATHLALEATIVEVDAAGNVLGAPSAGITFPTVPPVCQAGSSISPDGQTLLCSIGAVPTGTTAFVTTQVAADNSTQNGSRFQVTYKVIEQDDAVETAPVRTDTIVVSSAPRFDLWKKSARSYVPYTAPAGHPQAGEVGGVYLFNIGILAGDGDARGLSMLAEYDADKDGAIDPGEDLNGNGTLDNVVTFTDNLSGLPAGSLLLDFHPSYGDGCGTNGGSQTSYNGYFFSAAPRGGSYPSIPDERETPDSGNWTCSVSGTTVTVTIANADWRGQRYPTQTGSGATLAADQKWLASGWVMVWVPASQIRLGNDGVDGTADDGQYLITNTVGDFDHDDIWGLNNYGAGTEPLVDDANAGHRRNSFDYTLVEGGIGWDKYYRKDNYPNTAWSGIPTNATYYYSGDGQVMDGTTFGTYQTLVNNSFEKRTGVQLCDSFDNSTYVLSPDASNRLWGAYFSGTSVDPALPSGLSAADLVVEFGTGINGGVAGNWADGNHAVPSDPATWGGDDHWQRPGWDLQKGVSCGDADSADGWFTLNSPFNPADLPAGVSLSDITKYRVRIAHPDIADTGDWHDRSALPPGMRITTTTRHTALPGLIDVTPGDGDPTNAYPTILANFATREFLNTDGTTNTFTNNFDPADYSSRSGSDRLTLTKAQVRIAKDFNEKTVGSGPNFLGGDDVTWNLSPTVSQIGDIVAPAATDVRIVDEFPVPLEYVSGSANPATFTDLESGAVYPVQFCLVAGCDKDNPAHWTNTEPADPLTVLGLMWDLGEVPLGTALPTFSYTTTIPLDTPHNTDFTNTSTISSPDDNASEARRSASTSIKALQTGAFAVRKRVYDPIIFTENSIGWELQYANVSAVDMPYDLIDILPWNGDGGAGLADPKSNPSHFDGALQLVSVVPAAGNVASTTYYTSAAPGTIKENPADASNDIAAGLWCSNDDAAAPNLGTAGCPLPDLSDATAFRIIGGPLLGSSGGNPSGGQKVIVQATTTGNSPANFYANEFVAKVPDAVIVLPVKSNEVYTRVWGGTIGDLVFEDVDRDGVFGAGDNPIGSVDLELIDSSGTVVDTTTTDANGRYRFDLILRPGDFRVRLAESSFNAGGALFAMVPTINPAADPDVDLNETADHDTVTALAGGNYESGVITIDIGTEPVGDDVAGFDTSGAVDSDSNMTVDFGLILPDLGLTVAKTVEDPDNAGTFVENIRVEPGTTATFKIVVTNTGEIDLNNVVVSDPLLSSCDNNIGALPANDGTTNSHIATYTCSQVMADSLLPNTASATGDPVDGRPSINGNDTASVVVVGKIGDTVWFDVDGDGVQDATESGIGGVDVTVTWFGPDGAAGGGDDVVYTTTTAADGTYLVENLDPGEYSVSVDPATLPNGMTQTFDSDGVGTANTSLTSLASGESDLAQDFAYTGSSSIGTVVFVDVDGDGVQDPGDTGIGGVDVTVTWFGPDGVAGGGDDVAYTTTTAADGTYSVDNLMEGEYSVEVDPASLPAGLSGTYDSDGIATPNVSELTLGANENNTAQNFGYNGSGSIGDTIWLDDNGDGVQDATESGIGGVDVAVTWFGPDGVAGGGDDVVYNTTTAADGTYSVGNLPPGEYSVVVDPATLPGGVTQTGDPDSVIDNTGSVTLAEGQNHLTSDFGYQGTGSIGDTVWYDINGDGVQDANESGLGGVDVTVNWAGLDGVFGNGDDVAYPTTTAADGTYLVNNLPAGDYKVVVDPATLPAGMVQTYDANGVGSANESGLSLAAGENNVDQDFGYTGTNSLGDKVWFDTNADGVMDAGEPGMPGVELTITWFGPDGAIGGGDDVVLPSVTTDSSGKYSVTNLPDGDYGVMVTSGVPAGYVNTHDENGDNDSQANATGLTGGAFHDTSDFGFSGSGSIGNTIYWDADGDGNQGANEPGIAGVDVTVTWFGPDGVAGGGDDIVYTATTATDGSYRIENLPAGEYSVSVDETDLPAGLTQSADPDSVLDSQSLVTLGVGESNLTQDFGYRGDSSIGDKVWYDLDGNGTQDANEPGVPGVGVTVTWFGPDGVAGGGDDVVFATTTDSNGTYQVPGLVEGDYSVQIDGSSLPQGVSSSGDSDGGDTTMTSVALGASEKNTDIDFSVKGSSTLIETVWNDVNGDGVHDATESGIAGVKVTVVWEGPNGPVTREVTTDSNGKWTLTDLPPGEYKVTYDPSTAPAGTALTTPEPGPVNLAVGETKQLELGMAKTGSISSTIWNDVDGDGKVDPGEKPLSGVKVQLLDADGNLVQTVTTDANGDYNFVGLIPGDYVVKVVPSTLPANYSRKNGNSLAVHVNSGQSVVNADMGYKAKVAPSKLAFTGSSGSIPAAAAVLLLLGLLLVGTSKRRLGSDSESLRG